MRYLKRESIEKNIIQADNAEEILEIIKNSSEMLENMPESYAIDPRNGLWIIYAPARAKRPHETSAGNGKVNGKECIICDSQEFDITPAVMARNLESKTDDGKNAITFINENLYPFFDPRGTRHIRRDKSLEGGLFLSWVSNIHTDIHEMPVEDHKICLDLIADFEEMILRTGRYQNEGHVQIIKNKGDAVGGSVEHGHYQIAYLNGLPLRIVQDIEFEKINGESFSKFLLKNNPPELLLKDYGEVVSLVPQCAMKRPLDIIIMPKNEKNHFYDLSSAERRQTAQALKDITLALSSMMPAIGREYAYNIEFHRGNYIEVLPFTQSDGGYEKMGIYVCQSSPQLTAEDYRKKFKELGI